MSIVWRAIITILVATVFGSNSRRIPAQEVPQRDGTQFGTAEFRGWSKEHEKELTAKLRSLYGDPKVKASVALEYAKATKPGATGRGVVVDERKGELTLDIDPCTGVIATFHEPYVVRDAGEVTCNGKKYPRKEVEQKSRAKK